MKIRQKLVWTVAVLSTVIGFGVSRGDEPVAAKREVTLQASGATFVEPVMKEWAAKYAHDTGVKVNYDAKGSGEGISNFVKKANDFSCSDMPMKKKQLEEGKLSSAEVIHVPLVLGAVVPMYNIPSVKEPLVFTGPVLGEIFTGKITNWNDAKIAELNKGVKLPDLKIQPVFREDASGTSFIFSDYLSKVSPGFKEAVGASTQPKWPANLGIRKPKSGGVSGYVTQTEGAIGYVELTFALDSKLTFGKVRNKAGKDILADLESITFAADAAMKNKQTSEPYSLHELTYNLTDAEGEKSYPISALSFALIRQKQTNEKGKDVVAFLKWATSADGQKIAVSKHYGSLPEALQKKILEKLEKVEFGSD